MHEIESAEATAIVDSSSADLVAEMNSKRQLMQAWPFVLVLGVGAAFAANAMGAPAWVWPAVAVLTLALTVIARYHDVLRKTTVVMYDMEPDAEAQFEKLHKALEALGDCGAAWHVSARGAVSDWKRNAGASSVVNRSRIRVTANGNPPNVRSNIATPSIPVGKQTLYFFPDKILVFEPNGVGAVSYGHLDISSAPSRFIEEEGVPRDAQVVDRTWKFVNKKGGPDRRFNNNRELPIALYEKIALTSNTGLNELLMVSRVGTGAAIAAALPR